MRLGRVPSTEAREELVAKTRMLWKEETASPKMGVQPLPSMIDCSNVREFLKEAQAECPELKPILQQKRAELDPERELKRKTGRPKQKNVLAPLESKQFRLSPKDGVLEGEVNLASEVLFVPCIPSVQVRTEGSPMTWRFWLFSHCHCTFVEPHRRAGPTFQLLRRVGWWSSLVHDFNKWYWSCSCRRHRGKAVQAPLRSLLADEGRAELFPWQDIMLDVQGPFPKSDMGNQYLLSWHCTCLKVPKLCAFKELQQGHFLRAVVTC